MENKELIKTAKQAMEDLLSMSKGKMLEHEQSAYNCLRLFCERLSVTESIRDIWKGVPEQCKWRATDEEGYVWLYEEKPEQTNGVIWTSKYGGVRARTSFCRGWKHSLIERPKK